MLDARLKIKKTIAAFADTLAPDAAEQTFRPREVHDAPLALARTVLPCASMTTAAGASPDETGFFLAHVAQSNEAPTTRPTETESETYEIVSELGRGGMGEVWRAVQRSLGRLLALMGVGLTLRRTASEGRGGNEDGR